MGFNSAFKGIIYIRSQYIQFEPSSKTNYVSSVTQRCQVLWVIGSTPSPYWYVGSLNHDTCWFWRLKAKQYAAKLIALFWRSWNRASWYMCAVKPTRCTIFEFIEYHSMCFGRSFCLSSGVQGCTYSIRYMSYRLVDCMLAGTRWNSPRLTGEMELSSISPVRRRQIMLVWGTIQEQC